MKLILFAAVAALSLGMAAEGHAQTTKATSKNTTTSGAVAGAEAIGAYFAPGAIGGGAGAGAAAAAATSTGGFNQPQMIMNTGSAPSTGTFNDCGIAWSAGLWILTASRTSESEDCKSQRQAIFAATHLGSRSIAFESMCAIDSFRKAVERTNEGQCAQTIQEREKARPMAAQPVASPIVRTASSLPPNCQVVQPGNYITCK